MKKRILNFHGNEYLSLDRYGIKESIEDPTIEKIFSVVGRHENKAKSIHS